jgi:phosphoribosyl-ATP pyrophosphohydrolase
MTVALLLFVACIPMNVFAPAPKIIFINSAADKAPQVSESVAIKDNTPDHAGHSHDDVDYVSYIDTYDESGNVAKIGEQGYETITAAIAAAKAGDTITFLADITEDVTISKAVTIDGNGKTYTGAMTLKADTTIKNVNFDGKGYNGYAVETRGANYVTIEACTAKNYGYGFVQTASGTVLTTVKNVTISDMNYGIKIDYSNAVVLENVDITAGVAAVLNSNYGEKTITIKNGKLNILGTWTRNDTIKTNYVFEGANTIDRFITDAAIDNFKLAVGATLTAPNDITATATEVGYTVKYENGTYKAVKIVAKIGEETYATLADAIAAAHKDDVIVLLADNNEFKQDTIVLNKGITLDLNGNKLTADYLVAFNGNHVVDNGNGTGLLNIANGNISLSSDNAYMPIYVDNCYKFAKATMQTKVATTTSNGFVFKFRPGFSTAIYEVLNSKEAVEASGLQVVVHITWTDANGWTRYQDFVCSAELIANMYKNNEATQLTVTGMSADLKNVTVALIATSNIGVNASSAPANISLPTENN